MITVSSVKLQDERDIEQLRRVALAQRTQIQQLLRVISKQAKEIDHLKGRESQQPVLPNLLLRRRRESNASKRADEPKPLQPRCIRAESFAQVDPPCAPSQMTPSQTTPAQTTPAQTTPAQNVAPAGGLPSKEGMQRLLNRTRSAFQPERLARRRTRYAAAKERTDASEVPEGTWFGADQATSSNAPVVTNELPAEEPRSIRPELVESDVSRVSSCHAEIAQESRIGTNRVDFSRVSRTRPGREVPSSKSPLLRSKHIGAFALPSSSRLDGFASLESISRGGSLNTRSLDVADIEGVNFDDIDFGDLGSL
ncbi:MAG: hypothetical protein AAF550_11485 [Myxococcota bacterium]